MTHWMASHSTTSMPRNISRYTKSAATADTVWQRCVQCPRKATVKCIWHWGWLKGSEGSTSLFASWPPARCLSIGALHGLVHFTASCEFTAYLAPPIAPCMTICTVTRCPCKTFFLLFTLCTRGALFKFPIRILEQCMDHVYGRGCIKQPMESLLSLEVVEQKEILGCRTKVCKCMSISLQRCKSGYREG